MRVMVLVKANDDSETGRVPRTEELAEMGEFNDKLVQAGIMLAADGLKASKFGKRVRFEESDRTVIDGPFAETKELVAGYWIWEVASIEEAVEWLKRAPFRGGAEVEIRPVFGVEDFGAEMTPELRAQEDRQRTQMGQG